MLIRLLYLFFILILTEIGSAQKKDTGITASFSFNDSKEINEINSKPAKFLHALHVSDRFGNAGCAAYMHGGLGSYINLGTGTELKPEEGSISLWFKMEAIVYSGKGNDVNPFMVTRNGILDSTGKNEDFCEAYVISYNYKVHKLNLASTQSEKKQATVHTKDTVTLFEWHHVVLTYDSTQISVYLDGVLDAQIPKHYKTIFSPTDSVMLGNTASIKNERYFCGAMDDIVIYNRAITPEEVAGLYNARDPNEFHYFMKWIKWLFVALLILAFIIWMVLRKLRKDIKLQEERNRINARMNELETRAIRTQMNPHFMFNALNTLQRFILEEDIANANSYLVKFSTLLRKLLESSASESISLKEEMDILSSYVEIEKLRFDKLFEFSISTDIQEPDKVQIPFMLIQPFVENSIWHGLLPKEGKRLLEVKFLNSDANTLFCIVMDNGVGRKKSFNKKDPFRKKSMAIEFIKQRLEILEKATTIKSSFTIIDKENKEGESEGTLIEIIIPKLKK